jgi:DNA-binding SARP family transcriptional activator
MCSIDVAAMTRPLPTRDLRAVEAESPILVCVLGSFRLLKWRSPVAVRSGGKTEALLCSLALRPSHGLARDALRSALWPGSEPRQAAQSLNSLVHSLHKRLGDALGGAPPVLLVDGCYRLNVEAGVRVDAVCFDALATDGERAAAAGDHASAAVFYRRAIDLYRGDLCSAGTDLHAVVEGERLRALSLTLRARLADSQYKRGDYETCLDQTLELLAADPCREEAHRLAMRCYVRRGERAQALRQYRLCEQILRGEFDAAPEAATTALFDKLRLDPNGI